MQSETRAIGQIQKGKEVDLEKQYENLLNIEADPERNTQVSLNKGNLQKSINGKGLYSIVCSEPLTLYEIHRLYQNKSAGVVQFRTTKMQLGYGTLRVQCTPSVKAEFLVGFVAAVIRHEPEDVAKGTGRSTDQMIQEADKLVALKQNEANVYIRKARSGRHSFRDVTLRE